MDTDDAHIVCEYLKENGFDAYVKRMMLFFSVAVIIRMDTFNVIMWPNKAAYLYGGGMVIRCDHIHLPCIESPRYVEELKDVLVKATEHWTTMSGKCVSKGD